MLLSKLAKLDSSSAAPQLRLKVEFRWRVTRKSSMLEAKLKNERSFWSSYLAKIQKPL